VRALWVLALLAACAGHAPTLAEQNLRPRKALVITGTVQHVQRDWTYEMPCGIIAQIMRRCDDVQAFNADVSDASGRSTPFMFFRHANGGPHPANGDVGTFTLHWDAVYRYLTCAQRAAVTSACTAEFVWVLESDADMRLQ